MTDAPDLGFRLDFTVPETEELTTGQPLPLLLSVINTSAIIDSYDAIIFGLDPSWVRPTTGPLRLFPGQRGNMVLEVTLPQTFPAGEHLLSLRVSSTVDPNRATRIQFPITVASTAGCQLQLEPQVVTTAKRARFDIVLQNGSNAPADFVLTARDAAHVLKTSFRPRRLRVAAGGFATARVAAVGGRPWFGSPRNRVLTVMATSQGQANGQVLESNGTIVQKPIIPRLALPLVMIVLLFGLWGMVGSVLVNKFVDHKGGAGMLTDAALNAQTAASLAALGPPTNGISGAVAISETGDPLAGATVSAYLSDNPTNSVSTAASDSKGGYRISGLKAGGYRLKMSAPGFPDRWYPNVGTFNAGATVSVVDGKATTNQNFSVNGLPGSISGTVMVPPGSGAVDSSGVAVTLRPVQPGTLAPEPGTPDAPGVTSTAQPAVGPGGRGVALQVLPADASPAMMPQSRITDASGAFSFKNLITPRTYQITYSLPGFGNQVSNVTLGPGETQAATPLTMIDKATAGTITGVVSDVSDPNKPVPLGGVTVVATNGTITVKATTATDPTSQSPPGTYVISGLATPSTYTLTFSLDGYATSTIGDVSVGAGQTVTENAGLAKGTNTVFGTVLVGQNGEPGAMVSITDGSTVRTAVSADSPPGTYSIADLPAGEFTITASMQGFSNAVRQVSVTPGPPIQVDLALQQGVGAIIGTVQAAPIGGKPFPIAGLVGIAATGTTAQNGTASADGSYALTDLPPGPYDLTYTSAGYAPFMAHVMVAANQNLQQDASLVPLAGSMSGLVSGPTLTALQGAPLAGVNVSVAGPASFTTQTAADGSWAVPKVPGAGAYAITFTFNGYVTQTVNVSVGPGQHLRVPPVVLAPAPGSITGQVETLTGPIGGVTVQLRPLAGTTAGAVIATVVSTGADPFHFDNLATPGGYELDFSGAGLVDIKVQVTLAPGEVRSLGALIMTFKSGTVSGTLEGPVTSAAPAPLPGIALLLSGGTSTLSAVTDSTGKFTFQNVPPSSYVLNLAAPGYVSQTKTFDLKPGADVQLGLIILPAADGSLTLLVSGPNGQPAPGAKAFLTPLNQGTQTRPVPCPQPTGCSVPPTAPLVISPLSTPGSYQLEITAFNLTTSTTQVFIGPGQNLNLGNIVLSAPQIQLTGTVTDTTTAPVPLALVSIAGPGAPSTPTTTTDGNGLYTFNNLTPGVYTVTVTAAGYKVQSKTAVVSGTQSPHPVDFALTGQPATVIVTVNFTGNGAAAGTCVARDSGDQQVSLGPPAGQSGQVIGGTTNPPVPANQAGPAAFQIVNVPSPGTYILTITTLPYSPFGTTMVSSKTVQRQVTVKAGQTVDVGQIDVPTGDCPGGNGTH